MDRNAADDAGSSSNASSSPSAGALPPNVRILGWASLVNDIASEAIYPLLPQFLISLGGGRTLLGFLEGLADTVASLIKLLSGAWSDRTGRRKSFIVVGYTLPSFSRPLLGLANSAWQVFALRLVDRIGKGLRTAPRDALIVESTPEIRRGSAFGFHRAMDHLGAAIGPLLAAGFLWFLPGNVRMLMLLTLIPGLIVVGLQAWGLHEAERHVVTSPHRLSRLPAGPFRLYLLSLVVFTFANSSDAFLLLRAGELGVTTVWLPILWSVFHLAKSIGNRLAGPMADLWSPRRLILIGWTCYAAVYMGFAFATSAWHAWALFLAYAVFFAVTEPAEKKLVSAFAPPGQSGAAFGWFHTALGLANLPSSLLFGWLYENSGVMAAFGWGAFAAIAAAILLALVPMDHSPSC